MNLVEVYYQGFELYSTERSAAFTKGIFVNTPLAGKSLTLEDYDDAHTLRLLARMYLLCENRAREDGLAAPHYSTDDSEQYNAAAFWVSAMLHPGSDYNYARRLAIGRAIRILDKMADRYAEREGFSELATSIASLGKDMRVLYTDVAYERHAKHRLKAA